jgi:hypothetical protein
MRTITVASLFATLAVSGFALSFSSHRNTAQPQTVLSASPIPICPDSHCNILSPR